MGRAVQPDGRRPGRDDRPARGGRGPEPAVRRRRVARAADAARGARRRGVDPARAPRRRCRPRAAGRASCSSPTSGGCATLVDDLMEVSRFDAGAEQVAVEPVDLGAARPGGRGGPPARGVARVCRTRRSSSRPTRDGSSGSSATCSTTPASMRRARRSTVALADRRPRRDRARGRRSRVRASRPTASSGSSSASTRPTRRATAAAAGWGWRSPRSTPRCSAATSPPRTWPRRRPAHRAPPACDRIVTPRRRGGDRPGGCWAS